MIQTIPRTPSRRANVDVGYPSREGIGSAVEVLVNLLIPEDIHGDDASAGLGDAGELDCFDNFDEDDAITAAVEEEEEEEEEDEDGLRPLESGDRYGYR